jgi:hypothetical protein
MFERVRNLFLQSDKSNNKNNHDTKEYMIQWFEYLNNSITDMILNKVEPMKISYPPIESNEGVR